jgi:hypothetical protein
VCSSDLDVLNPFDRRKFPFFAHDSAIKTERGAKWQISVKLRVFLDILSGRY